MRMHRTVVRALVVCLVALTGPVGLTGTSSTAAGGVLPEPVAVSGEAGPVAVRAAKPARRVTFEFKPDGRTTYQFYGRVQAARKKKIILFRSETERGDYRFFKSTRTDSRGRYAWRKQRADGWFYLKVPADARFARSYSKLIHVFYG